jgi:cytochrome P450
VATSSVPDVDLSTSKEFADGPPFEAFAAMREHEPVRWNSSADGGGFWSVTRFDDIEPIMRDWRTYSSERRGIFLGTILPLEFQRLGFSTMDPPEHDRQRGLLGKAFTPKAIAAPTLGMAEIIDELIDAMAERGECDFVTAFADELPLRVTANLLGVPASDRHRLFTWANQMADTELPLDQIFQMFGELTEYVLGLIKLRREQPGEDLLTRVIHTELDGERLRDDEIVMHFAQIMAGGNETTRNALAGGMLALMTEPGQRELLIDDPGLMPNAVEEVLRWHTPIMHSTRTATRDSEIAGIPIKEEDLVVAWHISAHRDPRANHDPERFDVGRGEVRQIAFGAGKHHCIGAALARLELSMAFTAILRRLPHLQQAGPLTRKPSNTFNWIVGLPVSCGAPVG